MANTIVITMYLILNITIQSMDYLDALLKLTNPKTDQPFNSFVISPTTTNHHETRATILNILGQLFMRCLTVTTVLRKFLGQRNLCKRPDLIK